MERNGRRRRSNDRIAAGRARTRGSLHALVRCAVLAALLVCVGGRDARAGGGSVLPGAAWPWGWLISVTYVAEEPFTDDQVKAIRDGVTTKKDILAWFGPPLAIARPGAIVKVPRPVIHQAGSDDVPTDDWFRRFRPERDTNADTVVYYYHDLTAKQLAYVPVPMSFELSPASPYGGEYAVSARMLWILIDRRTGIVVDHRLERAEGTESAGRFIPKPEDAGGPAGEESHVPWQK